MERRIGIPTKEEGVLLPLPADWIEDATDKDPEKVRKLFGTGGAFAKSKDPASAKQPRARKWFTSVDMAADRSSCNCGAYSNTDTRWE